MAVRFSIILSTRNRANYLEKTLRSFTKLASSSKWEIIIIDNASTDQTAKVLSELASTLEINLVILQEKNKGKSRALNTALKVAKGNIIVFTDDDCYPAPDYLEQLDEVFKEDEDIGFIGGRILLHDSSDISMTIQKSKTRKKIEPGDFIYTGVIQGANFAMKKQILQEIGGFDTNFGPGTPFIIEDIDIVARASIAGWKGFYDPRPLVFHHHRVQSKSVAKKKWKGYHIGRGAYYLKCCFSKQLRKKTLNTWRHKSIHQPLKTTFLELYGASYYSFTLIRNKLMPEHNRKK